MSDNEYFNFNELIDEAASEYINDIERKISDRGYTLEIEKDNYDYKYNLLKDGIIVAYVKGVQEPKEMYISQVTRLDDSARGSGELLLRYVNAKAFSEQRSVVFDAVGTEGRNFSKLLSYYNRLGYTRNSRNTSGTGVQKYKTPYLSLKFDGGKRRKKTRKLSKRR